MSQLHGLPVFSGPKTVILREFGIFLISCILLFPLAWIVLNGPELGYFELVGGFVALCFLGLRYRITALLSVAIPCSFGVLYVICALIVREPRDLFPYRTAVLLFLYGIPTGLCLRRLAQDSHEDAVAWALILFSGIMAAIAAMILQAAGAAHIITEFNLGNAIWRSNGTAEAQGLTFLRYFSINNIIIGIVPFTFFGLSTIPLLLIVRGRALRVSVVVLLYLNAYVNFQVATRTTFAAVIVYCIIIFPLIVRNRFFSKKAAFGTALFAVISFTLVWMYASSDILHFIGDRFSHAFSDERLPIWSESLRLLAENPQGGGIRQLSTNFWAHNLFLDAGLTNGWIALAALLWICGSAFVSAWRAAIEPTFMLSSVNVILLGWMTVGFLSSMIHPPLLPFLAVLLIGLGYFAPYNSPENKPS